MIKQIVYFIITTIYISLFISSNVFAVYKVMNEKVKVYSDSYQVEGSSLNSDNGTYYAYGENLSSNLARIKIVVTNGDTFKTKSLFVLYKNIFNKDYIIASSGNLINKSYGYVDIDLNEEMNIKIAVAMENQDKTHAFFINNSIVIGLLPKPVFSSGVSLKQIDSGISTRWNEASGTVDYYELYRSTSSASIGSLILTTEELTYNDTNVTSGVTYYYTAKACNDTGCSTGKQNYTIYNLNSECPETLSYKQDIIIPDNEIRFIEIPPSAIQNFLDNRNSILKNIDLNKYQLDPKIVERENKSWSVFIQDWNLSELSNDTPTHNKYSAAEIIYYASKENNINPVILLAYLQKEQGLITNSTDDNLQNILNRATGYGMKESGDDYKYYGFLAQLTGLSYEIDQEINKFQNAYIHSIDGYQILIQSAFAHFHYDYTPHFDSAYNLFLIYNDYRNYFFTNGYQLCNNQKTNFIFPSTAITDKDSNSVYAKEKNAFYASNNELAGQCTWYVYGRVLELTNAGYLKNEVEDHFYESFWGKINRDAKNWPDFLGGTWFCTSNETPLPIEKRKSGMIMVWKWGVHGHVAFVEEISADQLKYRVSDFNYGEDLLYQTRWYNFNGSDSVIGGTYPCFYSLETNNELVYNVWLEPEINSVSVNTPFNIEIHINTMNQKLGSYQFTVNFNTNMIQVDNSLIEQGVESGNDGFIGFVNDQEPGKLIINGFDTNGKGPSEDLNFLKLSFTTLEKSGNTNIEFSNPTLSDEHGKSISISQVKGSNIQITDFILGDVNGDTKITIVDALLVARYSVNLFVNTFFEGSADVNSDKKISIVDALLIARKSANLDSFRKRYSKRSENIAQIFLQPDQVEVEKNTNFELNIDASINNFKIGSYQFELTFDPSLLEVNIIKENNGAETGDDGFLSFVNTDNLNGKIIINGFDSNGIGPGDNLNIVKVHFNVLNSASTNINLVVQDFTNELGENIEFTSSSTVNIKTKNGNENSGGGGGCFISTLLNK